MKLNALLGQNRFIVGQGRRDAPLLLPPLEFGNVVPVELRAWVESASGALVTVDLSAYQITLLVGKPNSRPALGFWQLTTVYGASRAIASRASVEAVAVALGDTFGPVSVEGGGGSYLVTLVAVGVWALPTATFEGNTISAVTITEVTPGTVDTPAQYRVEVLEEGPGRIVPDDWDTGNTTPVNTFTQTSGRLWSLVLDTRVDNGFFTLTVDGVTTDFVSFGVGSYGVELALAVIGKPASVLPDERGGYWVKFAENVAAASVGGNLVILPYQTGNLDLTSTGVRELLDGLQFTSVKLVVLLAKEGENVTVASDVMLLMPVNQPVL